MTRCVCWTAGVRRKGSCPLKLTALRVQVSAGTPVTALVGALSGSAVDSLTYAVAYGGLQLNLSAVVAVTPGDPVAAASWALTSLRANCVLLPGLFVTPAATAFAVLPVAQVPVAYVLARTPASRSPSVFTLPLQAWTSPFEWRLWAVTGGYVLFAALCHTVFQGAAPWSSLLLAILGFNAQHTTATPAARLHATAFGFTAALLLVQYIAAASSLRASGPVVVISPTSNAAPATVCTLNDSAYLARTRSAFPGATVVPVASIGVALSPACPNSVVTTADLAFAGACTSVVAQQLGSTTTATLSLSLSLQGDFARALSVLLAAAQMPGGTAYAGLSAASCGTLGSSASSAWQPTTLRDLSGIFLLQGAAVLAAALLHITQLATTRFLSRRSDASQDGSEAEAAAEGGARTWWPCGRAPEQDSQDGDGDVELSSGGTPLDAARKPQAGRSPSPLRASDALRASVARMGGGAPPAPGWRSNPLATGGEDVHRNAVLAQLRSDLLAAEAQRPVVARSVAAPQPPPMAPHMAPRQQQQQHRSAPGSSVGGAAPRGRPVMPRDYDMDSRL